MFASPGSFAVASTERAVQAPMALARMSGVAGACDGTSAGRRSPP